MTHRQVGKEITPGRPFLITPSDTVNFVAGGLPVTTRAISFASAGALSVVTLDDETVIIPDGALAAGVQHVMRIKRINNTGTTATGIVGYTHQLI